MVAASTAIEKVGAGPAIKGVVTAFPVDIVGAAKPVQNVIPQPAVDRVIQFGTGDLVVAVAAGQRCHALSPRDGSGRINRMRTRGKALAFSGSRARLHRGAEGVAGTL